MFKVTFKGKQTGEATLDQPANLLVAAAKGEVALNHRCGGHARCGTCMVTVETGAEHLTPVGAAEARILKVLRADPRQRLACQAWAEDDVSCRLS